MQIFRSSQRKVLEDPWGDYQSASSLGRRQVWKAKARFNFSSHPGPCFLHALSCWASIEKFCSGCAVISARRPVGRVRVSWMLGWSCILASISGTSFLSAASMSLEEFSLSSSLLSPDCVYLFGPASGIKPQNVDCVTSVQGSNVCI